MTLLVILVCSWGFVELSDEVFEGETRLFDQWVLESLREDQHPGTPIGPSWLPKVIRDLTALGGVAVLTVLTVTAAGFCLLAGDRVAMGTVLVASIGGKTLNFLLKDLLYRPRPDIVPHLVQVTSPSFPSGHSMGSAAVYLTLGILLAQRAPRRSWKMYFLAVMISLTVIVGFTRVYLGVHYPTDVLAGWTAGTVWALLCGLAANRFQRACRVDEAD
jgi:undecaprenyl-diphosphatase